MKTIAILSLLFFNLIDSKAQKTQTNNIDRKTLVKQSFPTINAKTLLGNTIEFPNISKNKITVVCIAFNDNGKEKFETWMNTIPNKYSDSSVVYYELALIKNTPKLFREAIEKGMRKGSPTNLHGNLANYYGKIDTYKNTLLMTNEDSCYVFLLDKEGKIQYSVEGATSTENLETLDQKIKILK
jgi:ATP10 protein